MTKSKNKINDSSLNSRLMVPILFTLIIGISLSLGAFFFGRIMEKENIKDSFLKDAKERAIYLANDIAANLEALISIKSFFLASTNFERDEFRVFVRPFLSKNTGIQALEWIPRVPDDQRAAYEKVAQQDGLLDFQISEHKSQGGVKRAEQREEYFPVYFVEPLKGNEAAVGFDLASNPIRLETLTRSRDTGKMLSTARITLVQKTGKQFSFLVFMPVYAQDVSLETVKDRREHLKGFALGVFRINEIMKRSLNSLDSADIDISLYDLDAPEERRFLHTYHAHQRPWADDNISEKEQYSPDLQYAKTIDVAGRKWKILCEADRTLISRGKTWIPWGFLLSGLIITFLITNNLFNVVRRNISISNAYRKLEEEVAKRVVDKKKVERIAVELTQLIDTANAPIFGVDVDGNINEWNQMVARITGYDKDEVTGNNLVETYITGEYKVPVQEVLDNALKGQETDNYEVPLFTKDGRRVMVLLNATTRRDAEGNIVGVVGVGQDITELSEHRENLEGLIDSRTNELNQALSDTENARDRIDGIIKSVADGLIVTDTYNRIILMNRASEDLLGVRFSEVVERPIDFAIKEKTLREKVRETLDRKTAGYQFDFELSAHDPKHSRIMRARTSVIHDKDDKESGIVTIIHDVTHEREVDRMKTEFISTAAHELRTPLTSIQGFSEILLMRENLKPEEKKKFLTYINKQSVGLAAIINDLLDISRIESGRGFALNKISCNAGDAIDQIILYFEENYKDHQFETVLPEKAVPLVVDKKKMGQVLKNLVGNAVKYSPGGGLIRVSGEQLGDHYQVSVEDQGMGMTPEQIDKVFDKFYRVDASNTAIEGTGLGMTIVKHIVEAHGGKVRIESELGKGTTVRFTIPT